MDITTDIIGLSAGFFVILAFYSQTPRLLRSFALISNVLFICYGVLADVMPVLVLHAVLLPLNLIRSLQLAEVKSWSLWKIRASWRGPAGILMVCVAAFLWATVGVASQLMTHEIEPAVIGFARTLVGCIFILAFTLTLNGPKAPSFDGNALLPLLSFGVCCAMFQICLFTAFDVVGVTVTVAVTVCLPPLIVQVLDAAWFRVPVGRNLMLSMAVAIVGVVLVLTKDPEQISAFHTDKIYGGAMLLLASFAFAGVAISARFVGAGQDTLQATGLGLGVCAVVLFVACVALPRDSLESIRLISWQDAAVLAYIGIFATGLAYLSFVIGLKLSRSAGTGMAATLIEPAAAASLAALLLGERLSALQLTGCVTMLFAIALLLKDENKEEFPLRPEPATSD